MAVSRVSGLSGSMLSLLQAQVVVRGHVLLQGSQPLLLASSLTETEHCWELSPSVAAALSSHCSLLEIHVFYSTARLLDQNFPGCGPDLDSCGRQLELTISRTLWEEELGPVACHEVPVCPNCLWHVHSMCCPLPTPRQTYCTFSDPEPVSLAQFPFLGNCVPRVPFTLSAV